MDINWHMGAFDTRVIGGGYELSNAFNKYKLAVALNIADIKAAYIDESM